MGFLDNPEAPNLKKFSNPLRPTMVCPAGDSVMRTISSHPNLKGLTPPLNSSLPYLFLASQKEMCLVSVFFFIGRDLFLQKFIYFKNFVTPPSSNQLNKPCFIMNVTSLHSSTFDYIFTL